MLLWLAAGVAAPATSEWAARGMLRRHIALLVAGVVTPLTPLEVGLPARAVLPDLLRGRLAQVDVIADLLALPGIEMSEVSMALREIQLRRDLSVRAGAGTLRGHITAEEVMARAGVPGALELHDGALTMRWPTPRSGRPSLAVRLRPVLVGDRIRLAPTPVTLSLPALPDGVRLTDVQARPYGLHVEAELDLPTLLNSSD